MILDFKNKLTKEIIEISNNRVMLHPLIVKSSISVISANAGHMKTSMTLNIIKGIRKQFKSMECYWFDYDNGFKRAVSNEGADKIFNDLNVQIVSISNSKEHEEIIVALDSLTSMDTLANTILVFDGLQSLFGRIGKSINDSDDAGQVMDMMKALRDKGATIIIIHHNNKADKDGWSTFRGSQVIEDSVDNMYILKSEQNDKTIDISIKINKYDGNHEDIYNGMTKAVSVEKATSIYCWDKSIEDAIKVWSPSPQQVLALKFIISIPPTVKSKLAILLKESTGYGDNKNRALIEDLVSHGLLQVVIGEKNAQIISVPMEFKITSKG